MGVSSCSKISVKLARAELLKSLSQISEAQLQCGEVVEHSIVTVGLLALALGEKAVEEGSSRRSGSVRVSRRGDVERAAAEQAAA